ncbi:MAG: ATP-binding cassette domain-containing protein [Methylomarinum sp.]|nr:ATP-binding cassette domain-containing protein [Methylomarinum sp.]
MSNKPSNIAIKVENLSKKYIIRHERKSGNYETFSDTLIQGSKNIANKIRHPFSGSQLDQQTQEEFWALKDINFEINQGDKVGIIGRNGAGKSTLLKVLSRITEPTSGKIHINGRIASLLEVGTGFHPELTGRENIYLNGAILGMSRREIKAKFDEIVAFAEVDKFLDTPVKRYSSGMYVRLAFSVAAHLEPEILVVDEVLAVGDAAFQKKCLGKMNDVADDGRTILFVSHNMAAITELCNSAIMLQHGELQKNSDVDSVIHHYMGGSSLQVFVYEAQSDFSHPYVRRIEITQEHSMGEAFKMNQPIKIIFELAKNNLVDIELGLRINNMQGLCIHHSSSAFSETPLIVHDTLECHIPAYGLAQGKYSMDFSLAKRNYQLFEKKEHILNFNVVFSGKLADKTSASDWKGICGPGIITW